MSEPDKAAHCITGCLKTLFWQTLFQIVWFVCCRFFFWLNFFFFLLLFLNISGMGNCCWKFWKFFFSFSYKMFMNICISTGEMSFEGQPLCKTKNKVEMTKLESSPCNHWRLSSYPWDIWSEYICLGVKCQHMLTENFKIES